MFEHAEHIDDAFSFKDNILRMFPFISFLFPAMSSLFKLFQYKTANYKQRNYCICKFNLFLFPIVN